MAVSSGPWATIASARRSSVSMASSAVSNDSRSTFDPWRTVSLQPLFATTAPVYLRSWWPSASPEAVGAVPEGIGAYL